MKANITEAKANLSKYIALVEEGEEILICRGKEPVAKITPYNSTEKRELGGCDIKITGDFDSKATNNEVAKLFGL